MSDIAVAHVLERLSTVCRREDLGSLADRLGRLSVLVAEGLAAVEGALDSAVHPSRGPERLVTGGAAHLVSSGGKRLRPTCVLLAARVGGRPAPNAHELAVAVELVHSATLLHDDVVDVGETRRGRPTTRALFGNSTSIFAGDWLLVEALRRVQRVASPEVLVRLLDAIEEMILAESLQLENRGRLVLDETVWRRVAEGKTASLFAWGMLAGGAAGGANVEETAALERFGRRLGTAFQAVDDVLDFDGDPLATGKALFTDLREGKATYPLILAARRDPALAAMLAKTGPSGALDDARLAADVLASLRRTGALEEARAFAADQGEQARAELAKVPEGAARDALETVLDAPLGRTS